MRRAATVLLAVCLAAAGFAGCGGTTTVREPDLVIDGDAASRPAPAPRQREGEAEGADEVRIAVVTHGQASSAFWAIVRNGMQTAARQVDATVTYRSPDVFSVERMSELIDAAAASRPDGLVVSLPDPAVRPAIRRAVAAGIPVVSINSGYDQFDRFGAMAHVGQDEARAGFEAGRRLAAAGVEHAVCLNLEKGNAALDTRCASFARALRARGATSRSVEVNLDDPAATRRLLTGVFRSERIDGALALSSSGAEAALDALRAVRRLGDVRIGTFDMSPVVLRAVRAGDVLFAIDQQPWLQGYLPVVYLTERARYGVFPSEGDVVRTGPHFVTEAEAAQAEALSRRGIR